MRSPFYFRRPYNYPGYPRYPHNTNINTTNNVEQSNEIETNNNSDMNSNTEYNLKTPCNYTRHNYGQKKTLNSDTEYFEVLGLKLFYDDILLIGLIFLLLKEESHDQFLIIALILLIG